MILAAGEGRRMLPLTATTPKPLLEAGGKPLIVHHIEKLAAAGITELVINHAHLGEKLEAALGDGDRFGVRIAWSAEGRRLETAGGILHALPLLGGEPFLVVNADIWTDYSFTRLPELAPGILCHLIMVDNPPQHAAGDFVLQADGLLALPEEAPDLPTLTYSGISLYRPDFFAGRPQGFQPMLPLWQDAIRARRVSAEHHRGAWTDVGTPERLEALNRKLREQSTL